MDMENVVVVLARPGESRNVGAVCRAMANSGASKLRVVGARADYDDGHVRALALHAAPVWERAEFFVSVADAVKDCALAAGTTRRRGKKRGKLLLPEEFARACGKFAHGERAGIAVVFGNERTGLTEEELSECTVGVTIPSADSFASLNLSHAVQIVCYELFRANVALSPGTVPVSLGRLGKTVEAICENLQKIGFFSLNGREDMERFWRNVLSRAAVSEGEARYIEKTFAKMGGLAGKNRTNRGEA